MTTRTFSLNLIGTVIVGPFLAGVLAARMLVAHFHHGLVAFWLLCFMGVCLYGFVETIQAYDRSH